MTPLNSRWLQAVWLALACIATPCRAANDWVEDAKGCKVIAQRGVANETVEWSGTCRDGLADGRGQLRRFIAGRQVLTYDGDMKAGKESGQGVLTAGTSMRYEGGFLDGLYAGAGRQTDDRGGIRQGTFVAGRLEGPCTLVWENGVRYDGECQWGSADGPGQLQYTNGDRYTGSVRFNMPSGQGRYAWKNGDVYEGGFKGGVLAGNGDYRFADGSRYMGAFSGNRPAGQGRVVLADGLGYEGSFERSAPTGAGRFFKPGEDALPDSPQLRVQLSLSYAAPQQAFVVQTQVMRPIKRVTAQMVCQTMGRPQVPPINWKGEALYKVMAEVRDGRVVGVTMSAPKPADNPVAHARMMESIERTLRQTYACAGNHVFEQEFMFRYD